MWSLDFTAQSEDVFRGALRKNRMVFQQQDIAEVVRSRVIDPDCGSCRGERRGRMQDRLVDRADLSSMQRVSANSSASGISFRQSAACSRLSSSCSRPAVLWKLQRVLGGSANVGDAGRAGCRRREPRRCAHRRPCRGCAAGHLVIGCVRRGRGARLIGRDGSGRAAHVHHHDLVAETVRLHKCVAGKRAQLDDPWNSRYMAKNRDASRRAWAAA